MKKPTKWQQTTSRSQLRSGVQSKARAFLRKLDKLEAAKKAKEAHG